MDKNSIIAPDEYITAEKLVNEINNLLETLSLSPEATVYVRTPENKFRRISDVYSEKDEESEQSISIIIEVE